MDDFMEWACSCRANFDSLVEEHGKIMVFQRELPICLRLVTKAIEVCKKRIEAESEQISNGGPVLEVFIPLKPIPFAEDEGIHRHDDKPVVEDEIPNRKPDWLRYAQLWNQDLDPPLIEVIPRKPVALHARKLGGGAFHPFEKRKQIPVADQSTPAESSTTETTTATRGEKEPVQSLTRSQSQSRRKARRSWSEDLHRRFMQALQQLGGSHAATPKQIRELMGVAGLTSDEVKSHLQKYRLHHRRTTPTLHNKWLSPPEYATAVAAVIAASQAIESTGAPINGIYAPITSQPSEYRSQHQQSSNEERCSNNHSILADDGVINSHSHISSSSDMITASLSNDS